MFKIRQSKYRHVFCDAPKPEHCWTGFRASTVTGDQQYIKASAKYFALGMFGGGGPTFIGRLDRPGRFHPETSPHMSGHTGAVLDYDWNPFDDSMLASASEDTTIKIWSIPEDWEPTDEDGNAKAGQSLSKSVADLAGHKKKVTLIRFNPTANNVLASAAADSTVKVWDIERSEAINTCEDMTDLTQDLVWDFRGDNYATSNKDKFVRFMDARAGAVVNKIEKAHEGAKSVKLSYLGESGKFLTVGASRQSAREMKIWDLANTAAPIHTETIDTAAGILIPLYDSDSGVLYLAGKGDGIIRPFEFDEKEPYLHRLNDGFRSTVPTKGICMVPKRGLNIMHCETARLLKLTNDQGVHPLSFTVPRKSDAFQPDIFPDCPSLTPAHTAEQWAGGSSLPPVTMSLNPALAGTAVTTASPKKTTFRSVPQLTAELDEAKKRIEYLEGKLKESGISF